MEGGTHVTHSSKNTEYVTPQPLFDSLNLAYGPFTLDPAATKENAKCSAFLTKESESDGLSLSWMGCRVFCNPPYGRHVTGKWVKKGYEEAQKKDTLVCMLLPARTCSVWFHDYILGKADVIEFIKGRIKFEGYTTGAPYPSMIVVWGLNK